MINTKDVKEGASKVGEFASVGGGLVAGTIVGSKIPSMDFLTKVPVVGDWLAKLAPGALLMVLAYVGGSKLKNEYAQAAAMGLGWAGVLDALRRSGALAKINEMFPTGLSGLGLVQNYAAYPASYFLDSNRADGGRTLSGLGENGISLQGPGDAGGGLQGNGISLQGQDKTGTSLQGRLGCMFQ